jgi:hypothetical protein
MGAHLSRDEALSEHVPTWLAEIVVETGVWPVKNEDGEKATQRERIILANLIRARRQAEAARVQLDAIEGLGAG